jgi:Beta-propeller repeat
MKQYQGSAQGPPFRKIGRLVRYQTTYPGIGGTAAFVSKLNPTVSGALSLIYSTFLGGNTGTVGTSIAVDFLGNAYVTGQTGRWFSNSAHPVPFPTTQSAFQPGPESLFTAFVTKFNAGGSGLVYSTLLGNGPGQNNQGNGVALDSFGDAYVTGYTGATNFPTTPDAFQPSYPGGGKNSGLNAFLTKFNSTGSTLMYSSYLGGSKDDIATAIAVDPAGDAYLTGYTSSPDFPTAVAFQSFLNLNVNGPNDAFVAKFRPGAGNQLSIDAVIPERGGTRVRLR